MAGLQCLLRNLTFFSMKPVGVSEPGDREWKPDAVKAVKTALFPRQLWGPRVAPRTPDEHRPPMQTLVLRLYPGQETFHSRKIILLLIISHFQ